MTKNFKIEMITIPEYDNYGNGGFDEWITFFDEKDVLGQNFPYNYIGFRRSMVSLLEKHGWNMDRLPKKVCLKIEIDILEDY